MPLIGTKPLAIMRLFAAPFQAGCMLVTAGLLPCLATDISAHPAPTKPIGYPATSMSSRKGPDTYSEGLAGSWLMFSKTDGLFFENRYLGRSLLQASLAATLAATTAKLPAVIGCTGSLSTFLARLPALLLPGYLLHHHWSQPDNWHTNRIVIVDNPTLADRLSVTLSTMLSSRQVEKLVFQLPPFPPTTAMEANGVNITTPLGRLVDLMTTLGSDYLEVRWCGNRSPVQITVGGRGQKSHVITLPPGYPNLAGGHDQTLPATLALLQPVGLRFIGSLLQCIGNNLAGRKPCSHGILKLAVSTGVANYFYYHLSAQADICQPLIGKAVANRYLVPLPPCQDESHCAMAMVWETGQQHLPPSGQPLLLYTQPVQLLKLPKRHTPVSPPMLATVSPWQTDLLTMIPYTAVYLLVDYLLTKGVGGYGIAGSSVIGSGLGAWGLAPVDDQAHRLRPSQADSGSIGSFDFGDDDHLGRKFSGPSTSAALLERQMLRALEASGGRAVAEPDLFVEEVLDEPTLTHVGNNCFFNASLTWLAHTLTPDELKAIDEDHYLSECRRQELIEDDDLMAAYKNLRGRFTGLMRAMEPDTFTALTRRERDSLQRGLYRALKIYLGAAQGEHAALAEMLVPQQMSRLGQEDAHEFICAFMSIFHVQQNRAGSVLLADSKEVYRDGRVGVKHHVDQNTRFNILQLSLPDESKIKAGKVHNINRLLNHSFLDKEWVDTPQNRLWVSPSEARDMGLGTLLDSEKLPFSIRYFLAHEQSNQLQHLSLQFKLYSYNTGAQSEKICTFTRRLLTGKGAIFIPVSNLSRTRTATIKMEPDAMILHRGPSLHSGHYMAAVRRGHEWFIYDDTAAHVVRLRSNRRLWQHSPLQMLNSYLEFHSLDPYIIHYRR